MIQEVLHLTVTHDLWFWVLLSCFPS